MSMSAQSRRHVLVGPVGEVQQSAPTAEVDSFCVAKHWEGGVRDASSNRFDLTVLFIVDGVHRSISFYRDKLGFDVTFQGPPAPDQNPFFAIVARNDAMLFLKRSGEPLPNPKR